MTVGGVVDHRHAGGIQPCTKLRVQSVAVVVVDEEHRGARGSVFGDDLLRQESRLVDVARGQPEGVRSDLAQQGGGARRGDLDHMARVVDLRRREARATVRVPDDAEDRRIARQLVRRRERRAGARAAASGDDPQLEQVSVYAAGGVDPGRGKPRSHDRLVGDHDADPDRLVGSTARGHRSQQRDQRHQRHGGPADDEDPAAWRCRKAHCPTSLKKLVTTVLAPFLRSRTTLLLWCFHRRCRHLWSIPRRAKLLRGPPTTDAGQLRGTPGRGRGPNGGPRRRHTLPGRDQVTRSLRSGSCLVRFPWVLALKKRAPRLWEPSARPPLVGTGETGTESQCRSALPPTLNPGFRNPGAPHPDAERNGRKASSGPEA